jgi:hypothetical protein
LTSNEQEGDYRVKDAMLHIEPIQPVAQEMQDQEEINGDKNCIDRQLDCKHAQAFGTVFFHEESIEGLKRYNVWASESFPSRKWSAIMLFPFEQSMPLIFAEIRASATLWLRLNQSAGTLLR